MINRKIKANKSPGSIYDFNINYPQVNVFICFFLELQAIKQFDCLKGPRPGSHLGGYADIPINSFGLNFDNVGAHQYVEYPPNVIIPVARGSSANEKRDYSLVKPQEIVSNDGLSINPFAYYQFFEDNKMVLFIWLCVLPFRFHVSSFYF